MSQEDQYFLEQSHGDGDGDEDLDDGADSSEAAARKRNRDHAQLTRIRKKAHIEQVLKSSFESEGGLLPKN